MENISIKPNQPMNLSLENVSHLKNPRLFISLDSDDQPNLLRSSVSSTSIPSLEYHDHHQSKQCTSCDALKRMLYLRDRTIMKLAEDRDMIKIKLTKAMNMNIELSRQLMKYQKMNLNATDSVVPSITSNPGNSPLRSKSPVNTQIREEVADLRRKCTELDEIYHHLKHHLFALRNVFADLGANTTNDSGSGYHMEDAEDDCSSINSSLSRASFLKQNGFNKNKLKNKAHIVEDDEVGDEEEDDADADGNESTDTDFHPLPPTRSALKNHQGFNKNVTNNSHNKVDNNNNSGTATAQQHHQQDKAQTESSEQELIKKKEVKSNVEIAPHDEPQLSNFDIWYNS